MVSIYLLNVTLFFFFTRKKKKKASAESKYVAKIVGGIGDMRRVEMIT